MFSKIWSVIRTVVAVVLPFLKAVPAPAKPCPPKGK